MTTIVDALDDPDLFGPLFPGASWGAWRAFLAAVFGLQMQDDALLLYQHHTGRTAPPARPFREAALVIGRRGGKSRVLALIAVYLAAFVDYSGQLAPGEQPVIAIIAADRRQARVLLRYVIGTLRAVPMLSTLIDGEPLAESVVLTNGVVIEIHTSSIGSPRGRTFVAALADEIAFWSTDDGGANPDREVIAAVRPGLASIPNSVLLMASSPYAKRGVLWQMFRQNWARDSARTLVWRGTTAEMNPTLDPAIIVEAYEADPESAASEYGAEFRSDIAAFVDRAVVEALVEPGRFERPPVAGIGYVGFADPSGGSSDAFTLAVAHAEGERAVVDLVRAVDPPFSPESVSTEFAAVLRSYGISRVTGDRYAGEWPREQFRKHGIEYLPSDKNKSELYKELLPLLNGGKAELLDNPRLVAQLCALERRTARGGRDSIDHPPGGHDDLANAAAGALVLAASAAAPSLIRAADLLGADGKPVALPSFCDFIFASLAVDQLGRAAAIFWSRSKHTGISLILLDFEISPLGEGLFSSIGQRLVDLARQCRHRAPVQPGVFTVAPLAQQAIARGVSAVAIDEIAAADPAALALAAAGYVAAGAVKIAQPAHEKSRRHPLGAALDFRADSRGDDPLRLAALWGIVAALDLDAAARAA